MSTYGYRDGTASIALDDGKVNALGSATLAQLNEHLDRALHDGASAVILTGRPGMFSAGFDLGEVRSGTPAREHRGAHSSTSNCDSLRSLAQW